MGFFNSANTYHFEPSLERRILELRRKRKRRPKHGRRLLLRSRRHRRLLLLQKFEIGTVYSSPEFNALDWEFEDTLFADAAMLRDDQNWRPTERNLQ